MALFLTGDTHGSFSRFASRNFPAQKGLTKEDCVLICGDFGGVWDGSAQQEFWLDWLEGKPFTTLFVSGNHENFHALKEYPEREWRGGRVRAVRESVLHLLRGEMFQLEGRTFFTMGGASSHDMEDGILDPADPLYGEKARRLRRRGGRFRVLGKSWWPEELPGEAEYETARRNLDRVGWRVDHIVTHCAPTHIQARVGGGDYRADRLTEFLEEVAERCRFRSWYFGHYHGERTVEERFHLLYEGIHPLEEK